MIDPANIDWEPEPTTFGAPMNRVHDVVLNHTLHRYLNASGPTSIGGVSEQVNSDVSIAEASGRWTVSNASSWARRWSWLGP